jgi:hypothetical protein
MLSISGGNLYELPYLTSESQAILYGLQQSCTLKEEKQDTSHMFLPHKRAHKIGNHLPLSLI